MIKTKYPSISVLIPTKNGGGTLSEVLAVLSIQSIEINDILVADSASDDNTTDIARKFGAKILTIDPKTFDHGGTRTILCKHSRSEILVFLTQDAILKGRDSLEKLVAPLLDDDSVSASYGRQLATFDADHFAESLREFNYPQTSAVYSHEDRDRIGIKAVFTSNSFACYRKSALAEVGYFQDGLIFGEDTVAVGRLLLKKHKNAYAADALVYHSHNNNPVDEFKRYFDIGVFHTQQKWLLDEYGNTSKQGKRYIYHEFKGILRKKRYSLLPELFLRLAMKYCGYKMGRYYNRLPMAIISICTMHRGWWQKNIDQT